MDTISVNSFYYFYSAVPQVLGGILAIMGFFLIFKIQTLKEELVAKAIEINNLIKSNIDPGNTKSQLQSDYESIKQNIENRNIKNIRLYILYSVDKKMKTNLLFKLYSEEYIGTFNLYRKLMYSTMGTSIYTSVIILICLSILPFGKYFLTNHGVLQTVFIITIVSIVLCFFGFITLIYFSLSNRTYEIDLADFLEKHKFNEMPENKKVT